MNLPSDKTMETIWKINWLLKEREHTTEDLEFIIEHLQALEYGSKWDNEPLSSILRDVEKPTSLKELLKS